MLWMLLKLLFASVRGRVDAEVDSHSTNTLQPLPPHRPCTLSISQTGGLSYLRLQVGSGSGKVGEEIRAEIGSQKDGSLHLWSPDSPYLYDLDVTLSLPSNSDKVGPCFFPLVSPLSDILQR